MGTGIYAMWGFEVSQSDIDFWCNLCKYPTEDERCKKKSNIRKCFSLNNAHDWHLAHECPMAHGGEPCRCNELAQLKAAQ